MEPYRVLLADDEEEIRAGISRKIDWSSLGFALVGEAENGQEALELAEQLRPDVVLTDIKRRACPCCVKCSTPGCWMDRYGLI